MNQSGDYTSLIPVLTGRPDAKTLADGAYGKYLPHAEPAAHTDLVTEQAAVRWLLKLNGLNPKMKFVFFIRFYNWRQKQAFAEVDANFFKLTWALLTEGQKNDLFDVLLLSYNRTKPGEHHQLRYPLPLLRRQHAHVAYLANKFNNPVLMLPLMTPPETRWKVLFSDGIQRVLTSKKLEILLAQRTPFIPSIRYVWFKQSWHDLLTPAAVLPSNDPDTLKFHLKQKRLVPECGAIAVGKTSPLVNLLEKHRTAYAQ